MFSIRKRNAANLYRLPVGHGSGGHHHHHHRCQIVSVGLVKTFPVIRGERTTDPATSLDVVYQ